MYIYVYVCIYIYMYIGRNFRWKYNTRNKLAQKLFDYSVAH